jgi:AraC-like DNA-binding protein
MQPTIVTAASADNREVARGFMVVVLQELKRAAWRRILPAAGGAGLNERAESMTDGGRPGRMVGRVHFWQGGIVWIGVGRGRTGWHAHHAHQLAFALGVPFAFRADPAHAPQPYRGAFVPSHQLHEFEAEGPLAHLFVEPETREGRALAARFGVAGISDLQGEQAQAVSSALAAALDDGRAAEALVDAARGAVAALAALPASAAQAPVDPRLAKAIDHLREHVRSGSTLAEAAAVATLSPSRFRHLFVQQTGSSFRAYLLWLRINVAIEAAMRGASWTDAAHDAGFADSPHLSRTFRRMFGINPATLVFR